MFSSTKGKLLIGLYVFLVLSIPVGAYLASQRQIYKSGAQEPRPSFTPHPKTITSTPSAQLSPLDQLKDLSSTNSSSASASPSPKPSITAAVSFGPTLSLKLILEGRPKDNQTAKVFVGVASGNPTSKPKYLLSFTIDLPASGIFSGLSLAGLSPGDLYTAYIKGPAQIATSSAFTMSPSETKLNNGQAVTLLTGDLNEDNTVNSADYSIAKAALGTTSKSANWNENIDFNKDGVVNSVDLSYIIKNFTKSGDSGVWVSPVPTRTATSSASLNSSIGGPGESTPSGGYWIWVPK